MDYFSKKVIYNLHIMKLHMNKRIFSNHNAKYLQTLHLWSINLDIKDRTHFLWITHQLDMKSRMVNKKNLLLYLFLRKLLQQPFCYEEGIKVALRLQAFLCITQSSGHTFLTAMATHTYCWSSCWQNLYQCLQAWDTFFCLYLKSYWKCANNNNLHIGHLITFPYCLYSFVFVNPCFIKNSLFSKLQ